MQRIPTYRPGVLPGVSPVVKGHDDMGWLGLVRPQYGISRSGESDQHGRGMNQKAVRAGWSGIFFIWQLKRRFCPD